LLIPASFLFWLTFSGRGRGIKKGGSYNLKAGDLRVFLGNFKIFLGGEF